MQKLIDPYGRPLEGLRVSVNAECNFKCIFCHMEGISSKQNIMKVEDYEIIAEAFKQLGGKEVKITGGEPLLRSDVSEIVRKFASRGLKTSLTTNGFLLERHVQALKSAGTHHINVSLHSLDPLVFKKLTGGDLPTVLRGIEAAVRRGIRVKLNYVILRENVRELPKIIEFAGSIKSDINLIQLIPLFYNAGNGNARVRLDLIKWRSLDSSIDGIMEYLSRNSVKTYYKKPHNRKVYQLSNGVNVTVIRGYENPFACYNCTRIRITPDAKIKTCLYANEPYIDLTQALKKRDVALAKMLIAKSVWLRKPRFMPSRVSASTRG